MLPRVLLLSAAFAGAMAAATLANGRVRAEFNNRGLTSLHDDEAGATHRFPADDFSIRIAGQLYESSSLPEPTRKTGPSRVAYSYQAGPYQIDLIYEVLPEWRFLSKQIVINTGPPGKFHLDEITVFRSSVAEPVRDSYTIARGRENLGTGDYGGFLRFDKSQGLAVAAQNPFLAFKRDAGAFTLSYKPDMDWDLSWGPFEADRGLLAPYKLSGRTLPQSMLAEWRLQKIDATPGMDEAEVDSFTDMVRAFLLYRPTAPLNIMVGWCANDYQIDIATAEGRAEYKRILDSAASLGAEHVLFAPANSDLAKRQEARDDWKWEHSLWLGFGPRIRRNEWDPATGAIPASLQEMLDYARSQKLKLVAYVYPVMGFTQNKEWLLGAKGTRANLGVHSLQDWLIASLEGFLKHTGISGYAFDHTFLTYEGASRYAQWWGWRRVLETLRRDLPDIVIDGRQAYQNYGPWTWLAGSYPHPTSTDEQPESFVSFPDLKLDRVSADRERYTAYRYKNYEFAPSEIVPGFITHQTARSDDSGHMPADGDTLLPFRRRDWDYLGWRYSLLSSIAVAGWNNVIDLIPARDPEEFQNFSDADKRFFRHWIDWTDVNKDYLRHTRTILGQPAIGKVDGTSAIVEDSGYVFLFNPNGKHLEARFRLDETIGMPEPRRRAKYVIREFYPVEERLIGKPGAGIWTAGDEVALDMDGGSAMVLRIEPFESGDEIKLFNSPGAATLDAGVLRLVNLQAEMGTTPTLQIWAPSAKKIDSIVIGDWLMPVDPAWRKSGNLIEFPVTFEGARFRKYQEVSSSFRIPKRVFDQMEARRKAWPIPWTAEDLRSSWLAPERLLLFLQFAEPDDRWTAKLTIDGKPVELQKAYASVRPNRRNFTGFYADISKLAPDVEHHIEMDLSADLKEGQFLGMFCENVEPEYTSRVVRR